MVPHYFLAEQIKYENEQIQALQDESTIMTADCLPTCLTFNSYLDMSEIGETIVTVILQDNNLAFSNLGKNKML